MGRWWRRRKEFDIPSEEINRVIEEGESVEFGGAAEYYQAHRDDEILWGEPEHRPEVIKDSGRPIQPRRLDQIISVRLSTEEAAFLQDKANAAGCSMSELIREAITKLNPATLFIDGRRVS